VFHLSPEGVEGKLSSGNDFRSGEILMNITAIALVALSLSAAAGSTFAATPASDLDYLKASRCRGIATAVGADASALQAYLKAEGGSRAPYIQTRAEDEFDRARREARGEGRARLAAELAGPCVAYQGQARTLAAR
jgi:hypothetical protein